MKFSIIIPARYASTRLPGKPLQDIAGKPMIQRVWEQAKLSSAERVVIATDHHEIDATAQAFGAQVCMTRADHESGTDRLAEVVSKLGLADDEIVVNVQGDEPLIPPAVIDQVAANLAANGKASCATISEAIKDAGLYLNPNAVKVVSDQQGLALYFSRAPMPWNRDVLAEGVEATQALQAFLAEQPAYKHVGIYAYRVKLLKDFVQWPQSPLEHIEKLEQLRILHQGHRIHVAEACEDVPGGIDTQADLEAVRLLLQGESS
ncbi:3-deoxy-manno-octulosonate cytidylyltransferase [Agaribacterium sp. ZY112]|uniref:3-deoxy-manno-octulosonate cytidylyltransferase n=1 Tax=Agaribacterium sp. ZY112 TaxID=3233574 RepID=UPI0035259641